MLGSEKECSEPSKSGMEPAILHERLSQSRALMEPEQWQLEVARVDCDQ